MYTKQNVVSIAIVSFNVKYVRASKNVKSSKLPRFLGGSVPYNPPEFCPASTGGCSKCKKYMKKIKFGITGKLLTREVLRWKIF